MVKRDAFQKYLEAGIAFTHITRARAEELVSELVQSGEFQGRDARAKVDEIIERSKKSREVLVTQVRHEVVRQLDNIGITSVEDLANQVADLLGRTAEAGRAAAAKKAAAKKAAAKKAPAKKAPAKKAAAKKAPAKKAPAKKAPAKKAAAKKAAAKKAAAKKAPTTTSTSAGSAD
jgi:polyhydroxyalkanoate synthesis regulator phasin